MHKVQIAVSNATYHFDKLYTYTVPLSLQSSVQIGSIALVPFGRNSSKARLGVVLKDASNEQDDIKLKAVFDIAPESANLTKELLSIVHYLKDTTFCTYYDAVRAIIPYGAQYRPAFGEKPYLKKQITRHTELFYKRAQKAEKLTAKQQIAWDTLQDNSMSAQNLEELGVTKNILKRMCENGILTAEQKNIEIELYTQGIAKQSPQDIVLSPAQSEAYNKIEQMREKNLPCVALLHGVTSSGKTLVFLKLIENTLKQNKTALVLVPEISLTPQMVHRLKANFGEKVAVLHSALNNTERLLQFERIQNSKADIVVGTRSAIFSPLKNIGLIIIDEEQEHTYHSESAPRYCAKEIAKLRIAKHNALLVLASATPSVSSYFAAQSGKYELVQIKERYGGVPLPQVDFIDMRQELISGNVGAISVQMQNALSEVLQSKQQAILLLNRRGYQTVGMCTECSQVLKCDVCSVPMVHHKADNKLMCHYCAKTITPVLETCPQCSGRIKYTGFGTQRIEEELLEKLPNSRILRMDADSTRRKNAHEKMLRQFAQGKYDILIGTQMVAKGLDFENVSLVGVIGIDQLLFAQGYKAFENVFSLITQVVGRSGRAKKQGKALIQTVDPEHPVLNLAAQQNYSSFYEQEISFRKMNLYPPYCTLCVLGFVGEQESMVLKASMFFAKSVEKHIKQIGGIPIRVLGPAPMHINVINGKYRYQLTLKCRNDKQFRNMLSLALLDYQKQELQQKTAIFVDFYSDADL